MNENKGNIMNKEKLSEIISLKDKYILDDNNNVIEADLMTWGDFFENERERRIVRQEYVDNLKVSTVFIGLDHKFNLSEEKKQPDYKPDIFETMIFKGKEDIYCDRYSTWQEAEEGHKKAIKWIKEGCKDESMD